MIRDIFDVFMEHCFDMANYAGLGPAVSDTIKWLSYRQKVVKKDVDNVGEKGYNKNDNQIRRKERQNANTRTDEFRQLQEESRRMPETELQAYHSGERTIDEALRGRLSGIFERQLGSFFGRNGDGVQLLTLDSKKGSYKIYSNIGGTLFHDCFEIARCYLENGELVDLHDNYDDATCYLSGDGLSGFAITDTGDLISVFNVSGKDTFRPDVLSIRRMRTYGNRPTEVYQQLIERGDIDGYSRWSNDVARGERPRCRDCSENERVYAGYSETWGRTGQKEIERTARMGQGKKAEGAERVETITPTTDDGTTLRDEMEKAWGRGTERYIRNLLMSLEGELKGTDGAKIINKLVRNAKIASVAGNARVIGLPLRRKKKKSELRGENGEKGATSNKTTILFN